MHWRPPDRRRGPCEDLLHVPLNYENLADQENLADFRIPKNTEEYLRSVGCSSFEGTCSSVCVCARACV